MSNMSDNLNPTSVQILTKDHGFSPTADPTATSESRVYYCVSEAEHAESDPLSPLLF